MSTFEVKTRRIDKIIHHEMAEKLEIVMIGGYRAVVQKGTHSEGDLILYIPDETVFTDMDIAEKLQVAAYLTGKGKNRVKPIRLRGALSQGIVLPISVVGDLLVELGCGHQTFIEDLDFSEELKLEKYEESIPIEMTGVQRNWPSFVPHYDLENIKRPENFGSIHDGELVEVTEKLHGTNISIAIGPGLDEGEEAFVCSRNHALRESDTNVYWRATRQYMLIDRLKQWIADNHRAWSSGRGEPMETVSLHGEVIGTQDLKYGFTGGNIGFFAFDIMVNGEPLDRSQFKSICTYYGIPMVPTLYNGPYDYNKIVALIETKSLIADNIMEGGVVEPVVGRRDYFGNRVKLKLIAEQYLTRKGGTEMQ